MSTATGDYPWYTGPTPNDMPYLTTIIPGPGTYIPPDPMQRIAEAMERIAAALEKLAPKDNGGKGP